MKDEKNTLKGTLEANQMSNRIPPYITNHSLNLVYILLTKENRFCFVLFLNLMSSKRNWGGRLAQLVKAWCL